MAKYTIDLKVSATGEAKDASVVAREIFRQTRALIEQGPLSGPALDRVGAAVRRSPTKPAAVRRAPSKPAATRRSGGKRAAKATRKRGR